MKNKKSKSNRKKAKNTPQQTEQVAATKNSPKVDSTSQQQKDTLQAKHGFVFGKKNYMFMFIGLAVIALGFILMAGGGSDDPKVFNEDVFSTRRIHIAPMVVIIGFIIEVYAILLNPNSDS
ncbi:DUF3098 domain-containing protein [Kordia sp.]|uniref:DUF3098 domain-containing protein n=1 Tax=Kordia sp. TaxID=1965332 RepID=UPI00344BB1A2